MSLRNGLAGRQDGLDDLLSQHRGGALNLFAGYRSRALDIGLRQLNPFLGLLTGVAESRFAFGLQTLQLLLAHGKNLRTRSAKLLLVSGGLCFGRGNRAACLLDGPGGASAPLGQCVLERTADKHAVSNDKQDEKDRSRYSAEQQTTKLVENFHVVFGG